MNRLSGRYVGKTSVLALFIWQLLTGLNSGVDAASTAHA